MNFMRNSCSGFCRLQSLWPLQPACCRDNFFFRHHAKPADADAHPWVVIPSAVLIFFLTFDREKVPCTDRAHWVLSPLFRTSIGDTIFEMMKEKRGHAILDPSEPYTVHVRHIASSIICAAHDLFPTNSPHDDDKQDKTALRHDLNWRVIIVNNEKAKTYSLPNGKIVVYTGLLNRVNNDVEIAARIAHEAGHVVANHHMELSRIIPFHDKLASQRNEMEADLIGLKLLATAGFDTHIAHGVYEKSGEIGRGSWSRFHPWCKKE